MTRVVPYSPLGKGFLTGTVSPSTEFADGDVRNTIPRFEAGNIDANAALLDRIRALATERNATPGQIALAWLLAQQSWIVPIPVLLSVTVAAFGALFALWLALSAIATLVFIGWLGVVATLVWVLYRLIKGWLALLAHAAPGSYV